MAGAIRFSSAVTVAILEAIRGVVGLQPQVVFYGVGPGQSIPLSCDVPEGPDYGFIIAESQCPDSSWMGPYPLPWEMRNTAGTWTAESVEVGEIVYMRIIDASSREVFMQAEVDIDGPGAVSACRIDSKTVTELGQIITMADIRFVTPQHPSAT